MGWASHLLLVQTEPQKAASCCPDCNTFAQEDCWNTVNIMFLVIELIQAPSTCGQGHLGVSVDSVVKWIELQPSFPGPTSSWSLLSYRPVVQLPGPSWFLLSCLLGTSFASLLLVCQSGHVCVNLCLSLVSAWFRDADQIPGCLLH